MPHHRGRTERRDSCPCPAFAACRRVTGSGAPCPWSVVTGFIGGIRPSAEGAAVAEGGGGYSCREAT